VILRVVRDGAVLSVVKDRRALRIADPSLMRWYRPPHSYRHPTLADQPEAARR
jgi:hypothetical protein